MNKFVIIIIIIIVSFSFCNHMQTWPHGPIELLAEVITLANRCSPNVFWPLQIPITSNFIKFLLLVCSLVSQNWGAEIYRGAE